VSENDSCHCAGTTKVAVEVMGRSTRRGKPWGDLGKRTEGVDVTSRDRLFQIRATGKPDRRR